MTIQLNMEPDYRLVLALLFSILLHIAAIAGIGRFDMLTPLTKRSPPSPRLEITLRPKKKDEGPKKIQQPDFFAQKNTAGSAKVEKKAPPLSQPSEQTLSPTSTAISTGKKAEKKSSPAKRKDLTAMQTTPSPSQQTQKQVPHPTTSALRAPTSEPSEVSEVQPPSAQELIAALKGQLATESQRHSKQPRKRYINFRNRDYTTMAYLDAWSKKIERIGKMNYPKEAKRRGLSGSLSLEVDLNPNGTLANIVVRRSSGYKILDEAAVRIVQLAAPFAKVPESILQGHDILSITRRWQFHSNSDFRAH